MHWTNDPGSPLAGIAAKLERANQNIINLHAEILAFFERSEYPVIPDTNDKLWQEAVNYHKQLGVPKRFSVLAGEIIHHLRSCLDHIVWIFSNANARRSHENVLEFPIFREDPTMDKGELKRFERKIQGVDKSSVRDLIWQVQPYQCGPGVLDDPLLIVHDMDRFDKHRELVIVSGCANLTFPNSTPETIAKVMAYRRGKIPSTDDFAAIKRAIKQEAKVFPQVAFAKFGQRESQFVIPSLAKLLNAIADVTELFSREL